MKTYKERTSECNGIVYNNNLPEIKAFLDKYNLDFIAEYKQFIIVGHYDRIKIIAQGDLLLVFEGCKDSIFCIPEYVWKVRYEIISEGRYRKIPKKGVIAIKYDKEDTKSKDTIYNILQQEIDGVTNMYEVDGVLHIEDDIHVATIHNNRIITIHKGSWDSYNEETFEEIYEEE